MEKMPHKQLFQLYTWTEYLNKWVFPRTMGGHGKRVEKCAHALAMLSPRKFISDLLNNYLHASWSSFY